MKRPYVITGLDDPNGLDVKREFEEYYHEEIDRGKHYSNLDTLVEKGLVEKKQQDWRTNEYRLTDHGHREIADRRGWKREHAPWGGRGTMTETEGETATDEVDRGDVGQEEEEADETEDPGP